MELRAFAARVLDAETLDEKLAPPPRDLADDAPGAAERRAAPARPPGLAIARGGDVRVPPPEGMCDPAQRKRILHALANHELQAAELFAWALLAFPEAPAPFRRGCVAILADEQRHCRLYLERLAAHGGRFGDLPLSGLFWRRIDALRTPLDFVCTLGLTFENANLDFSLEHVRTARAAGDEETARVLETVHDDEVAHVAFAWRWMQAWKADGAGDWETFVASAPPRAPERARGATFDRAGREAAGLDAAFVARLEATSPTAPGGGAR